MVNISGNYRLLVRNALGCSDTSQVVTVNNLLGSNGQILISGPTNVCPSQSVWLTGTQLPNVAYRWLLNGQVVAGQTTHSILASTPGVYRLMVSNLAGSCSDTSGDFVLNAAQPVQTQQIAQACSGTGYLFDGVLYFSSGTYTSTLTSATGCDSVVTLHLTVGRDTSVHVSAAVCAPGNYVFGSQVLSTTGQYTQLFPTPLGCDSFVILNLTVHPQQTVTVLNQTICSPGSFAFNGQSYISSGVYTANLLNVSGCDSVVQLNLTVNPPSVVSLTQSVCFPSVVQVGNQNFGQSGMYSVQLMSVAGCDSLVNLDLTVHQPSSLSISDTICAPATYFFNGSQYASSGVYTAQLNNFVGCDSVVTLNLTVLPCNRIHGRISYLNRFATPMNLSQVQLLGGTTVLGTTTTDAQGLFTFNGLTSGQPYRFGVSTQKPWGGVNATDAFFVNQHFSGRLPLLGLFHSAADVNLSSVVNATDALQILSRYAVQGYSFASSDWVFSDTTVTLQNDTVAVHLRALTAGDANGSYVPVPGSRHAAGVVLQHDGFFSTSDREVPRCWPI